MSPAEFKATRRKLGLSVAQMADMLCVTHEHVRRMEMHESTKTRKPIMPATQRLLQAFRDGWRPHDWPENV